MFLGGTKQKKELGRFDGLIWPVQGYGCKKYKKVLKTILSSNLFVIYSIITVIISVSTAIPVIRVRKVTQNWHIHDGTWVS